MGSGRDDGAAADGAEVTITCSPLVMGMEESRPEVAGNGFGGYPNFTAPTSASRSDQVGERVDSLSCWLGGISVAEKMSTRRSSTVCESGSTSRVVTPRGCRRRICRVQSR